MGSEKLDFGICNFITKIVLPKHLEVLLRVPCGYMHVTALEERRVRISPQWHKTNERFIEVKEWTSTGLYKQNQRWQYWFIHIHHTVLTREDFLVLTRGDFSSSETLLVFIYIPVVILEAWWSPCCESNCAEGFFFIGDGEISMAEW